MIVTGRSPQRICGARLGLADASMAGAEAGLKPGRRLKSAPHASRLLICLAAALLVPALLWAQAYFVPGDPKAGMQIFFDKGCARCHAVLGEGGRTAPDLARAPVGHLSASELVAAMWNHAPGMWEKMRLERVPQPRFAPAEMMNLFAFLYSVRSLDEPGDAERGRKLLDEKHCLACHAIAGQGGRGGPDLARWAPYRNPVSWVQAMWNHGLTMQSMMAGRGLSWPEFRDGDMADLIACIRSLAMNPKPRPELRQANASAGRQVFQAKGCAQCHAIRGAGGARAPDLGAQPFPRTLGQFAGLMWNHAPAMWTSMQARRVAPPRFSNQEMADLIAYLFTERYFERAGSPGHGGRIFAEKGCGSCHESRASGAPDLVRWRGAASPVPVAAALWNHGPLMLERMQKQHIAWPRFAGGEMSDLMEFLNHGARAPVLRAKAGGKP